MSFGPLASSFDFDSRITMEESLHLRDFSMVGYVYFLEIKEFPGFCAEILEDFVCLNSGILEGLQTFLNNHKVHRSRSVFYFKFSLVKYKEFCSIFNNTLIFEMVFRIFGFKEQA
jgi:hypothetical protein